MSKTRLKIGIDVFNAALDRLIPLYEEGHRIVVSFSGGKDSTVALECAVAAASATGRLPVEVMMQDEEIAYPGTYEYALRTAERPDISFNWFICRQPMVNVYCRTEPYWWIFDPLLQPEQWVRTFPSFAKETKTLDLDALTSPANFPPPPGKNLYAVIGLRVAESRGRMYGLFASGSHITKPNPLGVRNVRPCYDWTTGDVWRAILLGKWDYNRAYDMMVKFGISRERMRVAPPTMNAFGVELLQMSQKAWPRWFDRVAARCPGVRTGAQFGKRAVTPNRKMGETWESCFRRECIDKAAAPFIAERSKLLMDRLVSTHSHHATTAFPDVLPCHTCFGNLGSWKALAMTMYNGDPYSSKTNGLLDVIEPEFLRPGSGRWMGKHAW